MTWRIHSPLLNAFFDVRRFRERKHVATFLHQATILRGEAWTQKELDTYLLLLCEDVTHGLDLSFVTHLFIVHRIGDPSRRSSLARTGWEPTLTSASRCRRCISSTRSPDEFTI